MVKEKRVTVTPAEPTVQEAREFSGAPIATEKDTLPPNKIIKANADGI